MLRVAGRLIRKDPSIRRSRNRNPRTARWHRAVLVWLLQCGLLGSQQSCPQHSLSGIIRIKTARFIRLLPGFRQSSHIRQQECQFSSRCCVLWSLFNDPANHRFAYITWFFTSPFDPQLMQSRKKRGSWLELIGARGRGTSFRFGQQLRRRAMCSIDRGSSSSTLCHKCSASSSRPSADMMPPQSAATHLGRTIARLFKYSLPPISCACRTINIRRQQTAAIDRHRDAFRIGAFEDLQGFRRPIELA